MDKRISIILKIFVVILFSLLLININKVYALEIDEIIERGYDKIETEDGTFYKRKKHDTSNTHIGYSGSGYSSESEEIYNKVCKIVNKKVEEYMKKYTLDTCPDEQKIAEKFYVGIGSLFRSEEIFDNFNNNKDISLLAAVYAQPVNGNSNYWKDNFSNNELSYDEYENKYSVIMYYFVRFSKSLETGQYEISYIDLKPENYDEYIAEFKETKGIDLENLDVERILNTEYVDKINVVPSSNTVALSADKTEYNSTRTEQISNIAVIIRIFCVLLLSISIIILIVRKKHR